MNNAIIISILLFTFFIFGIVISVFLFFFSKIQMGRTLGVMFFSSSVATFAYINQLSALSISGMFLWVLVRYISLLVFALTIALFVFDYVGISVPFKSWRFFRISIVPAMVLFLLAINPNSPFVYSQKGMSIIDMQRIDKMIGPLFIFMQAYVTGLLIFLIYCLLKNIREKTKLDRINSIFIASGLLLYVSTHLLSLGGKMLLFGVYSPNIFTYFPSSLFALWGVKRYRLADIRPIAYKTIFNQMQDSFLVVDRNGYLVDFNPTAQDFLGLIHHLSPGTLMDLNKLKIPGLEEFDRIGKEKIFRSEVNGIPCLIITSGLFDQRGDLYGHLVSIRDISSEVEAEKLKESETIRKGAWEERTRLARSLHDSALQNVGSLIMLTGSIRQSLGDHQSEGMLKHLDNITKGANLAYEDLRSFIDELQIDDESVDHEFNLKHALGSKLCNLQQQGNAKIQLNFPDNLPIAGQQQHELFYVILEAVNNAIKHADADLITIQIQVGQENVTVEIIDDGCGFDLQEPGDHGMGLKNIRSRASLLNGQLMILSKRAGGTSVKITVPLIRDIYATAIKGSNQ